MFLAHSIRLRDPWQCELISGGLRWTRTFHRPTGLESDDDLWLVLSGLPPDARIKVNGHDFEPQGQEPPDRRASATGKSASDAALQTPEHPDAAGDANPPSACPLPPSPRLLASFNLTPILADTNDIEIRLPLAAPPLRSRAPRLATPPAFPYDARLAIMARS